MVSQVKGAAELAELAELALACARDGPITNVRGTANSRVVEWRSCSRLSVRVLAVNLWKHLGALSASAEFGSLMMLNGPWFVSCRLRWKGSLPCGEETFVAPILLWLIMFLCLMISVVKYLMGLI